MDGLTLLLVDDHASFRAYARVLLAASGFVVVAAAANGREAHVLSARFRPRVVLLDVQLPDVDGFTVARELLRESQPPAVVLVSTREAVDYGRRVADSGAAGFISKSLLTGDTLQAILRDSFKEGSG